MGLIERPFKKEKTVDGQFRFGAFGDSFTEGAGAPMDSAWPRMSETEIKRSGRKDVAVLNLAVSGSDPVWNYKFFEDSLIHYDFDAIVLAINETDINDIYALTGMARFRPDNKVEYRSPPDYEWIYHYSHIARAIMHEVFGLDHMLLPESSQAEVQDYATRELCNTIGLFKQKCDAKGEWFGVVILPLKDNVEAKSHAFQGVIQEMNAMGVPYLDLLSDSIYNSIITPDNAQEFYWPIDQHHNSMGYYVVGKSVANWLIECALPKDDGTFE